MEGNSQRTIWTIGHSTRGIEAFTGLLQSFNIDVLADIRSFPGSRKYPHFNKEALAVAMGQAHISYVHFPGLGGRRKPRPDSVNTAWRNDAFKGYADYMETAEFGEAIKRLEQLATDHRLAYMCSEAVWWRCHRSLVSDYLKARGWRVMHIMEAGKATEHPYTAPAKEVQGRLFYD